MHKQKQQQQYISTNTNLKELPLVSTPCHSKWRNKGLLLALDHLNTEEHVRVLLTALGSLPDVPPK